MNDHETLKYLVLKLQDRVTLLERFVESVKHPKQTGSPYDLSARR